MYRLTLLGPGTRISGARRLLFITSRPSSGHNKLYVWDCGLANTDPMDEFTPILLHKITYPSDIVIKTVQTILLQTQSEYDIYTYYYSNPMLKFLFYDKRYIPRDLKICIAGLTGLCFDPCNAYPEIITSGYPSIPTEYCTLPTIAPKQCTVNEMDTGSYVEDIDIYVLGKNPFWITHVFAIDEESYNEGLAYIEGNQSVCLDSDINGIDAWGEWIDPLGILERYTIQSQWYNYHTLCLDTFDYYDTSFLIGSGYGGLDIELKWQYNDDLSPFTQRTLGTFDGGNIYACVQYGIDQYQVNGFFNGDFSDRPKYTGVDSGDSIGSACGVNVLITEEEDPEPPEEPEYISLSRYNLLDFDYSYLITNRPIADNTLLLNGSASYIVRSHLQSRSASSTLYLQQTVTKRTKPTRYNLIVYNGLSLDYNYILQTPGGGIYHTRATDNELLINGSVETEVYTERKPLVFELTASNNIVFDVISETSITHIIESEPIKECSIGNTILFSDYYSFPEVSSQTNANILTFSDSCVTIVTKPIDKTLLNIDIYSTITFSQSIETSIVSPPVIGGIQVETGNLLNISDIWHVGLLGSAISNIILFSDSHEESITKPPQLDNTIESFLTLSQTYTTIINEGLLVDIVVDIEDQLILADEYTTNIKTATFINSLSLEDDYDVVKISAISKQQNNITFMGTCSYTLKRLSISIEDQLSLIDEHSSQFVITEENNTLSLSDTITYRQTIKLDIQDFLVITQEPAIDDYIFIDVTDVLTLNQVANPNWVVFTYPDTSITFSDTYTAIAGKSYVEAIAVSDLSLSDYPNLNIIMGEASSSLTISSTINHYSPVWIDYENILIFDSDIEHLGCTYNLHLENTLLLTPIAQLKDPWYVGNNLVFEGTALAYNLTSQLIYHPFGVGL